MIGEIKIVYPKYTLAERLYIARNKAMLLLCNTREKLARYLFTLAIKTSEWPTHDARFAFKPFGWYPDFWNIEDVQGAIGSEIRPEHKELAYELLENTLNAMTPEVFEQLEFNAYNLGMLPMCRYPITQRRA